MTFFTDGTCCAMKSTVLRKLSNPQIGFASKNNAPTIPRNVPKRLSHDIANTPPEGVSPCHEKTRKPLLIYGW